MARHSSPLVSLPRVGLCVVHRQPVSSASPELDDDDTMTPYEFSFSDVRPRGGDGQYAFKTAKPDLLEVFHDGKW